MADTLNIFGTEYTGVTGIIAKDGNSTDLTFVRPQGTVNITSSGNTDVSAYATASVASADPYVAFHNNEFFTEDNQRQWHIQPFVEVDEGEGDTAGFLADGTSKNGEWYECYAVASGTSVTPTTSIQTIGGANYMMEGAVTVNAIPSSYVQPTTTVGSTTYRASTSSQTISSGTYHSAAATIAAVSQTNLSADNIKSGTTISISNGQSNLWSVTGTYTGGGGTSKNVQVLQSTSRTSSSSLTKVLGDLTVSKTGTYDIYWSGGRTNTSTSYTWGTRLYVDGTGYGTENTTWTNNCQSNHLSNVSLTANQKLSVYARGRTGSYYTFAPMLVIIEA